MRINHQLSCLSLVIFFLIAAASTGVNKIHCGAFEISTYKRDEMGKGNFIEKNDGSKIYGDRIVWSTGVLSNHSISIDKEKYKITEIKGYRLDGIYHARYHSQYLKRIVEGKVNVYFMRETSTETSTSQSGFTTTRQVEHCYFFAQRGDNGDIMPIADQDDIKEYIKDCPTSYAMIDKSNKQIRKSIRKEPDYLNQIFEIYNNNCK